MTMTLIMIIIMFRITSMRPLIMIMIRTMHLIISCDYDDDYAYDVLMILMWSTVKHMIMIIYECDYADY